MDVELELCMGVCGAIWWRLVNGNIIGGQTGHAAQAWRKRSGTLPVMGFEPEMF